MFRVEFITPHRVALAIILSPVLFVVVFSRSGNVWIPLVSSFHFIKYGM